jgi:MFS family permease
MSLTRDPNFRRFWLAQGCSLLGSQITLIAFPLIAIHSFQASTFAIGVLTAANYVPFLLFGLAAGVWVDHLDLKKVLITCDLARFLLLGAVPLLYAAGLLNLPVLCLVAFLSGFFTLIFDVGDHSFLPQITSDEKEIVEGNTKLYLSYSASQVAGPAIGGALVHAVTAPFAIVADCISYLVSGLLLTGVKIRTSTPEIIRPKPQMISEMKAGVRFVTRNDFLRPLILCMAVSNFFDLYGIVQAILVVFITRELGMSAWQLGAVLFISNLGAIIGTMANGRLVDRFGVGNTIVVSSFIPGAALLFLPLASAEWGLLSVGLPLFVANFGVSLFNVNQLSLRQQITPIALLGRMNATIRFLIWGTIPLGAFCGGVLGERIGLRPTLLIAAIGSVCAGLPVLFSRIGKLDALPARRTEMG